MQPFQWSYGQAQPTQNEFSWTNLSSMIYLEQPVGTGFSQGKPNVTVRPSQGPPINIETHLILIIMVSLGDRRTKTT